MNSFLIQQVIQVVAGLLLGSDVFTRILGVVERWADEKIDGASKRQGVLDELEVIGLTLTKSAANFGIELAVQFLKAKS
jgi:hypothetical protein